MAISGPHLRNENAKAHLGTSGEDGFKHLGHRVLVRNGREDGLERERLGRTHLHRVRVRWGLLM